MVQPANRAVLSRHHRQPVSLLGLWRSAGERFSRHRQPQRLRRNHLPRLDHHRRRRIRLRRARPAASQSDLRRQRHSLRPQHWQTRNVEPVVLRTGKYPLQSHRAADFLRQPIRTCSIWDQTCSSRPRRRQQLANHQSRPHARRSRHPRNSRPIRSRRSRQRQASRRDLFHSSIAERREPDLGRNRRWRDSSNSRRRQELAKRHSSRINVRGASSPNWTRHTSIPQPSMLP